MSVDDAVQVAAGRIALDDDPPPDILAIDRVRTAAALDRGDILQRNSAAGRQIQRQPAEPGKVFAKFIVQAHDQIELALALDDLGNDAAVHGRLDELVDVVRGQAIAGQLLAIELDLKLGNFDLLFDHQVLDARHALDRRLHFVGLARGGRSDRRR